MDAFEIITATLGVLGFFLSLIGLAWNMKELRPRLRVFPKRALGFPAEYKKESMPGLVLRGPLRIFIIDVEIEISNVSRRGNAVTDVSFGCDNEFGFLKKDRNYIIAENQMNLQAIFGFEKKATFPIGWEPPECSWDDLTPQIIQPGETKRARLCRTSTKEIDSIVVQVRDSHGRIYRQNGVALSRPELANPGAIPIDKATTPPDESVFAEEEADSKKKV